MSQTPFLINKDKGGMDQKLMEKCASYLWLKFVEQKGIWGMSF